MTQSEYAIVIGGIPWKDTATCPKAHIAFADRRKHLVLTGTHHADKDSFPGDSHVALLLGMTVEDGTRHAKGT